MQFKKALRNKSLAELEGEEYFGEYFAKTHKMGANISNQVSHAAYGYATQVCVLNKDGSILKMAAARDMGKVVNPKGVEGQNEGGVVDGTRPAAYYCTGSRRYCYRDDPQIVPEWV